MTDIALRHDPAPVQPYSGPPAHTAVVATLADWASELVAAGQIAEQLCRTSFVPKHFIGKPAECAAAILTGHELGLSPMASLRAIFLIGGTPGMYAKVMVAVLQSKGHEVWVAEQSDDRVVVRGQRKGSQHVHETTWDRARVLKAGLQTNAKYQTNPQQMMTARGQAEICRQVASDALHGVPYSVEELEDFGADRSEMPTMRVTAAEILGTVVPEIEQPPAQPAEMVQEGITKPQSTKLHAMLAERGYGDRDKGLTLLSMLLKKDVESTKDLSKTAATFLIDALERVPALPTDPSDDEEAWLDGQQPPDGDGAP